MGGKTVYLKTICVLQIMAQVLRFSFFLFTQLHAY